MTLPPDWVCEVHSESTRRHDRVRKPAVYTEFAVQWLWFVDPEVLTLEAFRRGPDGRWTLLGTWEGDARVRVEPFEALEFELGGLWELGAPPEAAAGAGTSVEASVAGVTAAEAGPLVAPGPSRPGG